MQKIEVSIDRETEVLTIEAIGYRGNGCEKDINEVMEKIGGITLSRTPKPENVQVVGLQRVRT